MDLTSFSRRIASALWPGLPRRRGPRPERAPDPFPAAELGGPLRAFRAAALWLLAAVVATATGSAFSESYRGLFDWAEHHDFSGFWAAAFPAQVDLFIVAGEVVLFLAMTDQWGWHDRLGAWLTALLGLTVSIAGNVGHISAHDLQSRGTAAVPPLAAFGALWLGLGVVKRILRYRRGQAVTAAQSAQVTAERDRLAAVLDELSGAVLLLAQRGTEPPPAVPDHSALLAELTATVRMLAERPADAAPALVPADAESAALIAMKASVAARNPLSQRQLEARFGLTRTQGTKVREAAGAADPIRYAMNGAVPRLRPAPDGAPAGG